MGNIYLQEISEEKIKSIVIEALLEVKNNENSISKNLINSDKLSRKETAKQLKISLTTLNKYSKLGYIQSYRMGKRILYKPDEVENSLIQVRNIKNRKGVIWNVK